MQVRLIRKTGESATDTTCPAVFATDAGTFAVVGRKITDAETLAQLNVGDDEYAVEVPADVLPELLHAAG